VHEDGRETLTVGSLFTGIGGLDLAVGGEHGWMCEYDKHCRGVLAERFPGVPCYPDVRELGADAPRVDVLCGGYPCQPFSVAGKRGGETDPRHLWPEFARLIGLLRPRFAVLENVRGHLGLGFDAVLAHLAGMGYDARWGVVRASDVGAPHQRARLFVVATDADWQGRQGAEPARGRLLPTGSRDAAPDADERDLRAGRGRRRVESGADARADKTATSDTASAERRDEERDRVGTAAKRTAEHRERARAVAWGVYEPAIRRWEHALGRPAPRPTDDRGRLMPEFVEWMMGFPDGWTAGPARKHRLRMLGNAVVPQQAALALELLA